MAARATITHDYIETDLVGKVFTFGEAQELSPESRVAFHLADDDGINYYIGTIESDSFDEESELYEYLWHWGATYAGTTALFINGGLVIG